MQETFTTGWQAYTIDGKKMDDMSPLSVQKGSQNIMELSHLVPVISLEFGTVWLSRTEAHIVGLNHKQGSAVNVMSYTIFIASNLIRTKRLKALEDTLELPWVTKSPKLLMYTLSFSLNHVPLANIKEGPGGGDYDLHHCQPPRDMFGFTFRELSCHPSPVN